MNIGRIVARGATAVRLPVGPARSGTTCHDPLPRTIGGTLTHVRTLLDCANRTASSRAAGQRQEASLGQFDRQDRRQVAVVVTADGRRVHMPIEPNPLADVSLLSLIRSLLSLDGLLGLITGSRRENGGSRRDER